MKFSEIINQAVTMLQAKGRITHRVLKREFALEKYTWYSMRQCFHPSGA